jgi:molybdopterin converting factor subunit 1
MSEHTNSSAPSGHVTVLFFAAARDAAKTGEWRCPVGEGETVATLKERVFSQFESLVAWRRALRFAVDGEYARDDEPVRAGCEVAVIPPVAGG